MAFRTQKISQMTPKGADLEATDLIEVSTIESGSYVTRSITGQELIDAIPPTAVEWGDIGGTLADQTDLNTSLNGKQATLVSGTNIKTINGSSMLGSGDFLTIPQLTSVQRDALTPVAGYPIYNTTEGYLETYDNFWGWMPVSSQNEWKRKWGLEYFQDFGSNTGFGDGVFTLFTQNGGAGGASSGTFPLTNDFIGLQGARTGTAANGLVQIRTDVNFGRFTMFSSGKIQFETRVWFQALSTATDRYNFVFGFTSTFTSAVTNGVCFVYDEGGVGVAASPNWQVVSASGGVRTLINTGVPVAINTFYSLRIDINETHTEAKYYLNGTLVYTSTTNIPTGNTGINATTAITKTAGTTNVNILYDYLGVKKKFTTPR